MNDAYDRLQRENAKHREALRQASIHLARDAQYGDKAERKAAIAIIDAALKGKPDGNRAEERQQA